MPAPTLEELHTAAAAEVARRLRDDAGVKALAGGRVAAPGEDAPAALPAVVLSLGRRLGPPPSAAPTLAQCDVRVECRAADRAVLHLLLIACQRVLNGSLGQPHYQQAVLTHTGAEDDADGVLGRRDVYGLFVRQTPAA